MGLFNRLFGLSINNPLPLVWDMHNHILPGIDDGSKDLQQSLEMAELYCELGYKRLIATPHIMSDAYRNTPEIIRSKMELLSAHLTQNGIDLPLECAAEYYLDEGFASMIETGQEILTFNGKHVLIETSFLNKPMFFSNIVFGLQSAGYLPVLAHPERYVYLQDNYNEAELILETGVKFQINLLALEGYYSPAAKKFAGWLIQNGHYHFLGTDAHKQEHLRLIKKVFSSALYSKIDFSKVENAH